MADSGPGTMAAIFGRLQKTTVFYLVRHGESEGNREQRIQGKTDLPLTDKGREHAALAGKWLSGHPVDAIYTSPLKRAGETSRIIRDTLSQATTPIRYLEDLEELDTGIFSGKTYKELQETMPGLWARFKLESWEAVPGAESIEHLQDRALRVWETLVEAANKGPSHLLAVSHGGFIQWMIKVSLGMNPGTWVPLIRISNCSISELRVEVMKDHAGQIAEKQEPGSPIEPARAFLPEWRHINHQPWV